MNPAISLTILLSDAYENHFAPTAQTGIHHIIVRSFDGPATAKGESLFLAELPDFLNFTFHFTILFYSFTLFTDVKLKTFF